MWYGYVAWRLYEYGTVANDAITAIKIVYRGSRAAYNGVKTVATALLPPSKQETVELDDWDWEMVG